MYCPRCGHCGHRLLRCLAVGPAAVLADVVTGFFIFFIAASFSLMLPPLAFIAVPFGLIAAGSIIANWLKLSCPKCAYPYSMSLSEYREKLKEPHYQPPHYRNRHEVYKNGQVIRWH